MKRRFVSFNTYFFSALFFALLCACETTRSGKDASTLRLHLEMNPDGTDRNSGVPIYREKPVLVNVNREPFLTEADIEVAAVVNVPGGFAIHIQFNRHGTLLLENVTTAYKGRRVAILSQFGESRWLAAPMLPRQITNGVIVFTPDASKEEADRIVRGLNNVAAKVKKSSRF